MAHQREIWIIDDHLLFSAGLKQMLSTITQSHQLSCFEHPTQATLSDADNEVALIVLDFYIPNSETLEWIANFKQSFPDAPVIVISSSISSMDKHDCLQAGASAYYPKHAPPDITLKNLQAFINGEKQHTGTVELRKIEHELTDRQMEILIQVSRGHSNKKIAKLLNISPETVKSHLATIYRIIDCQTRDQAIEWSRKQGLV